MIVFNSPRPLQWGALDVPLLGIGKDWHGSPFDPGAGYALAQDGQRLWFIASHTKPARIHPSARPGKFQPELWRYDVAELFLADPVSGRYFEFNLAPNGAWWSCEFTAPRVRYQEEDFQMPEVGAFAELAEDGSWAAALAIPLDILKARINYGPETRGNVTFILNSPDQKFLTAAKLSDGEPDYHLPGQFPTLQSRALPQL